VELIGRMRHLRGKKSQILKTVLMESGSWGGGWVWGGGGVGPTRRVVWGQPTSMRPVREVQGGGGAGVGGGGGGGVWGPGVGWEGARRRTATSTASPTPHRDSTAIDRKEGRNAGVRPTLRTY